MSTGIGSVIQRLGVLGVANGGTGADTARAAAAALRVPYVLAQSAVASSVTGTTSKTTLATVSVPAGAMGANGRIIVFSNWSVTNNANSKGLKIELGSTAFYNTGATSLLSVSDLRYIANRNSASSQVFGSTNSAVGIATSSSAVGTSSENTANALNLVFSAQLASAADTATLESYSVQLLYGA